MELEPQKASEILKKFQSTTSIVVHNSTSVRRGYLYFNSFMEIVESHFSEEDRGKIAAAQRNLQSKIKKATRQRKDELDNLLGKLSDKFQVELSSIERDGDSSYPLQVRLSDKSVVTPLHQWGAGTQNRTRVLMSVLEAVHARSSASSENRASPVFVVEEPESFLHPSAQAEFGKVLNGVASELGLQIIATTHSPYLLNQTSPDCNYLIHRKHFRNVPKGAALVDTSGGDWMKPFAETLGVVPSEFEGWREMFGSTSSDVILVEGEIDLEYFLFIKENYPSTYQLPDNIEVVPYGGSGALKNTAILAFMINKFKSVYVTCDLDCYGDVKPALERIGLVEEDDFCAIGRSVAGYDCIEGLLPNDVKERVYGGKIELVTALASQNSKERSNAKNRLKRELLDAFRSVKYQDSDLAEFKKLFKRIARKFN